jgi:hypothetical protein
LFSSSFIASMPKIAGAAKKLALPKFLKVPKTKAAPKINMSAIVSALRKQKMYSKMR